MSFVLKIDFKLSFQVTHCNEVSGCADDEPSCGFQGTQTDRTQMKATTPYEGIAACIGFEGSNALVRELHAQGPQGIHQADIVVFPANRISGFAVLGLAPAKAASLCVYATVSQGENLCSPDGCIEEA